MKSFEFDRWDSGRLTVNRAFGALLQSRGLTTCEVIWQFSLAAEAVKALRSDRVTLRFSLSDADGRTREFYIKRFLESSWLSGWSNSGAQQEWHALQAFHRHGLPTMTPVARGQFGDRSFLITEGLQSCRKLSNAFPNAAGDSSERRRMIVRTATIARSMHDSRLHHQDFYLGHLLESESQPETMYVIDLGRVESHWKLLARRWIVKDLAQLNYSAKDARPTERLRFLETYLGRKVEPGDRRLVRAILAKSSRIARHSAKHGL